MSDVLYEASPSMVRRHPLGTLLMIALVLFGLVMAVAGGSVLASFGIPVGDDRIPGVVGIVLVVAGLIRLLAWWIATKIDYLIIREDELIWTHGLLNKQYTEIDMGSVRTVRVNQGILQRIMDAGDVTVFTSGDAPELVVKGLPNPRAIRDFIRSET